LRADGDVSVKYTWETIIETPRPKPKKSRAKHTILIFKAKKKHISGPNIVKISEIIMDFFLPILSAIIPATIAPIVAPSTAVLTIFYIDY